jgi:uncharacterized membrane protein
MTRSGKGLLIALAVSLSINLVLVGFLAGRWLQSIGPPPGHDPTLMVWPAIQGLAPAERDALRPMLRESLHASRKQIRAIRRAQRSVQESLRSETFAASDLARSLDELRRALNDSQSARHATLVEVATQLSPDERRRLAAGMAAQRRLPPGQPPVAGPVPAP